MFLKTTSGKIIFESNYNTLKASLDQAVHEGVSLVNIDLRYANLSGLNLDNVKLNKACLWGANLTNTDLSGADLSEADCRNVNFLNSCMAESTCKKTMFQGSYFSSTILYGADLSDSIFSCPSIFNQNLNEIKIIDGTIYLHKGEVECDLSFTPFVIKGLSKKIILLKDKVIIGSNIYNVDLYNQIVEPFLKIMTFERMMLHETKQ